MRLAFINPNTAHDYDVATPDSQPLAGAESTQVYLAVAMAQRGHEVWLFNGTRASALLKGVYCVPLPAVLGELRGFDAYFVTNYRHFFSPLRAVTGPEPAIICWEHDLFGAEIGRERLAELDGPRDFLALVSDWHRRHFLQNVDFEPARAIVMRNAIAPFFENLFDGDENNLTAKASPTMSFTSTPYKGLMPAVQLFGVIRQYAPEASLSVYSSFDHYPPNNSNRQNQAGWQPLCDACYRSPGINYVGTLPQAELAQALKNSVALFYPNLVFETSSIAAMEAMAAGMVVITNPNGALPETLAGFGELVDMAPNGSGGLMIDPQGFCERTLEVLRKLRDRDPALADRLRRQVDYANQHCRWSVRAAETEAQLASILYKQ